MIPMLNRLKTDMLQAMKEGNTEKKVYLQVVVGDIDTELKRRKMTEEDIMEFLTSMKKKLVKSLDLYESQGRQDLLEKAKREIVILSEYLPKQLTEEEVRGMIESLVVELGISDMKGRGKLMGALMPKIKGLADGKMVNMIVEEVLRGSL